MRPPLLSRRANGCRAESRHAPSGGSRGLLLPHGMTAVLAGLLLCSACAVEPAGEAERAGRTADRMVPRPAAAPGRLARVLTRPPPARAEAEGALRTVRRGMELLSAGRARAADDSLAAATVTLAPARDWIRLGRARAAAVRGDTVRVRRMLEHLDPVPSRRWAWSIAVTARDSARDPAAAAATALRWAERTGDAGLQSAALLRAGRLLEEAGDERRARAAFLRSVDAAPWSREAVDAAEELAERSGLSPEEERAVGRALSADGQWWRGHRWLGRYLDSSAATAEADSVRLDYGRALLYAGRYPDAIRVLESLAERRPRLAPDALLLEARARLWHGEESDGVELLGEVARRFPERPEAGEALSELAAHAEEEGRPGAARGYWIRASRHAATAEEAERRLLRGGLLAYLASDYDSAAALFADRARTGSDRAARQRSVYWAGLAERAAGRPRRARSLLRAALNLDRFGYYGTRAAEILGRALLPADLPPGPRAGSELDSERANALLRLEAAEALSLDGAVATEVERLESYFGRRDGGRYALAEAMVAGGFPLRGVRVARGIEAGSEAPNLRLLRALYPFPLREEVRRVSRTRGLSPFLVAGLIRQESLFQPAIESYAGAIGLMQIMPGTGLDLAREHDVPGYRTSDLRRPSLNLRLGTAYLAELLGRFDGRTAYALAAYNAGPHRVSRWLRRPFAGDLDVFVEEIPFRQTRHYVKAVLAHARVYAALYGCGGFDPCLGREASLALRDDASGAESAPAAR